MIAFSQHMLRCTSLRDLIKDTLLMKEKEEKRRKGRTRGDSNPQLQDCWKPNEANASFYLGKYKKNQSLLVSYYSECFYRISTWRLTSSHKKSIQWKTKGPQIYLFTALHLMSLNSWAENVFIEQTLSNGSLLLEIDFQTQCSPWLTQFYSSQPPMAETVGI